MKGTRVQTVVQELRGEKIDIVPWTDDQAELVCRALAPAKVSKVIIDEDEHAMEVIVPDDQLRSRSESAARMSASPIGSPDGSLMFAARPRQKKKPATRANRSTRFPELET